MEHPVKRTGRHSVYGSLQSMRYRGEAGGMTKVQGNRSPFVTRTWILTKRWQGEGHTTKREERSEGAKQGSRAGAEPGRKTLAVQSTQRNTLHCVLEYHKHFVTCCHCFSTARLTAG